MFRTKILNIIIDEKFVNWYKTERYSHYNTFEYLKKLDMNNYDHIVIAIREIYKYLGFSSHFIKRGFETQKDVTSLNYYQVLGSSSLSTTNYEETMKIFNRLLNICLIHLFNKLEDEYGRVSLEAITLNNVKMLFKDKNTEIEEHNSAKNNFTIILNKLLMFLEENKNRKIEETKVTNPGDKEQDWNKVSVKFPTQDADKEREIEINLNSKAVLVKLKNHQLDDLMEYLFNTRNNTQTKEAKIILEKLEDLRDPKSYNDMYFRHVKFWLAKSIIFAKGKRSTLKDYDFYWKNREKIKVCLEEIEKQMGTGLEINIIKEEDKDKTDTIDTTLALNDKATNNNSNIQIIL